MKVPTGLVCTYLFQNKNISECNLARCNSLLDIRSISYKTFSRGGPEKGM